MKRVQRQQVAMIL